MANPEHVKILKQQVAIWNQWREGNPQEVPDLSGVDLSGADLRTPKAGPPVALKIKLSGPGLAEHGLIGAKLRGVSLRGANLSAADLSGADLRGTELVGTNLSGTDLKWANLSSADPSEANLCRADLRWTNLKSTILAHADLSGVVARSTAFSDVDLSAVRGLDTVSHEGPSTIGIDTVYLSRGNIPEGFLRGAGVPEDFIVYMRSLVGKAIEFYSCFISYSSKDGDFAQRLFADLQAKNVRCWKFDENAKWGEPVWGEIDTAIRYYDKLVVICSKHSLQSPPVIREIERALQREDREHKNVLFPIRIDDYLFDEWEHPRKADVVKNVAGDFCGWDNLATYSKVFPRFLDALNRPQQASKNR